MDIKDTLEEVKSRMASGYQTLERKIAFFSDFCLLAPSGRIWYHSPVVTVRWRRLGGRRGSPVMAGRVGA